MEVRCSFSSSVERPCSYDPRDRKQSKEVIPFLNCKRDITGHKSSLLITDVESEIELILSRALNIFSATRELNISELTICPYHRSSLGIGWRRGSNKCQVPPPISKHDESSQKVAKAERGLVGLFSCPEEGCIKRYKHYTHLQHHLDSGKHTIAVEREALLDRAVLGYAERLEVEQVGVPSVQNIQVPNEEPTQPLPMGWALRSSHTRRTRFTSNQKDYLTAKFNIGETTGCKADAVVVSREMMSARGSDGERLFRMDDFLTNQQITSFFSRLASKKSLPEDKDDNDDDDEAAAVESALEELGNQVQREIALQHPIVFDCHNICDLVKHGKLTKFNILMLKKMCEHFEIDTSEITVRLKRPYVDKLSTFCGNCSCQQ